MKAKTIWIEKESRPDTYAEFIGTFESNRQERVYINISCDSHFALYVNGELAKFGETADYPWYRLYHRFDITQYCNGQNEIRVEVWYKGEDSQTYIKNEAGLWFEIEQGEHKLLVSDEHILSRKNICYRNEYCKSLTPQLGFSFYYDHTVSNDLPYLPSVERDESCEFHERKTGYVSLGHRAPAIWKKLTDSYLIDLGEETVGFLDLSVQSSAEQELLIVYGELLRDGKVPRRITNRDFSVEIKIKEGKNEYLHPFRRLAGRYLQIYCKEPIEITYVGLRTTDMEVVEIPRSFDEPLLQKIYDVSVNTLKKCMHEHYEDCPWREQAMYTLDSRNQMLCGYYAFEGTEYQKENLLFTAKGQRKDGLLSLNFPGGIDIPIPFFSPVYLMQVCDYVTFTGDVELAWQVKPVIDRIMDTLEQRMDANGLLANFPYPYWNFYEWSKASDREEEIKRKPEDPYVKQYDLILNCMYVYSCGLYEKLYGEKIETEKTISAIRETFYCAEKGLYKLSTKGEDFSQLGNAFAILVGLGSKELAEKIMHDVNLIPVTLSMNTFYYDALLTFGEEYKEFIVQDMRNKYGSMLEQGATTFWETEDSLVQEEGAWSLCHGWSAIPVYYLVKFFMGKEEK